MRLPLCYTTDTLVLLALARTGSSSDATATAAAAAYFDCAWFSAPKRLPELVLRERMHTAPLLRTLLHSHTHRLAYYVGILTILLYAYYSLSLLLLLLLLLLPVTARLCRCDGKSLNEILKRIKHRVCDAPSLRGGLPLMTPRYRLLLLFCYCSCCCCCCCCCCLELHSVSSRRTSTGSVSQTSNVYSMPPCAAPPPLMF
jgi:hypothetical protein